MNRKGAPSFVLFVSLLCYSVGLAVENSIVGLKDTIKWVDTVDTWKAPENFVINMPYYLSGYDYEDRPIWVGEIGKFNIRSLVENKGAEALENLEKFILQGCLRVLKSVIEKDKPDREVRQAVGLLDCEGLNMWQVTHVPTIAFLIRKIQLYFDLASQSIGKAIFINANYAAEVALNVFRPVLGGIMENVEVYGSNKSKWMAKLRRLLPEESIPSWYGGSKDFHPLKVYG